MRRQFDAVILLSIVSLSGCAQLNEGAVDHRWATEPKCSQANRSLEFKFYAKPVNERIIRSGDSITITLETAFIRGFQEELGNERGEYVVLANVREFGKAGPIGYGADAENQARVIYYTGDLRQHEQGSYGQALSQVSLPLYGPIRYEGKPVLIEMHTVELDDSESETIKALLTTLASVGGKVYPPSSPALAILEQVGSHMLSGAQNDKEFRNHPVLYPYHGDDGSTHSFLQEGDIVIIKRGNTRYGVLSFRGDDSGPVPWDSLVLSLKDKKLYTTDNGNQTEYRGHTYFVINITTRQPSLANDIENSLYENFGTFMERMRGEVKVDAQRISATGASILGGLEDERVLNRAHSDISTLRDTASDPISREFAADRVLRLLKSELDPSSTDRKLTDDEVEQLLIRLRRAVPEAKRDQVSKSLFSRDLDAILQALDLK